MSKERRLGFEAFYSYCRLIDDAVDEAPSPQVAEVELKRWSEEIQRIYQGTPEHQVGKALASTVRRFDIPQQYLEEILAGCEMDLHNNSYQSFDDLTQYCYRVASCVGLVCLHLFEAELTEKTRQAAINLGLAVQMTNILRDVISDFDRNRVYLPLEDLQNFQITPNNFRQAENSQDNLLELINFEISRARSFYDKAWNDFPRDLRQNRQLLVAHMMGKIYQTILDKIAKDPLRIFREKVQLSRWTKLRISGQLIAKLYLQ